MRTCIYAGKSTFFKGTHALSVQNYCFLANNDEGAEITIGPELGALTLSEIASYASEQRNGQKVKFSLWDSFKTST